MHITATARDWLARATGIAPALLRLEPLAGATSSLVLRISAAQGGERFVLRVLDNADWLAEEPDIAEHEQAALAEAVRAGLPAPRPIAIAAEAGFGAPVVLMSCLDGAVDLCPPDEEAWLAALAGQLAAVHRHPAAALRWSFQSWVDVARLAPPAWSAQPGLWRRAIERWRAGPPPASIGFIHRDFHPANVLWREGIITGVVDWVSACRGPAGVDIAHCRTDLTLMRGPRAAAVFLAAYARAAPGYRHDPYWDIDAILDMCLPEPVYYPPWRAFGLADIPPATLRQRIEEQLQVVLARC